MTSPSGEMLLAASGVCKSFPGIRALLEVGFDLRPGEVHALVGENGAGKSTLARILAGLQTPDAGEIWLKGEPFSPRDRRDAEERGVRTVMQDLNVIPTLSVAENIFLDRMPHRLGVIRYRAMRDDARRIMAEVGLGEVDPSCPVQSLGIGQQQMVEIAAGLSRRCEVLILDEPTASLTDRETDLLFTQIARLKAQGTGIVYISHRMEEIRRIADRITVLRDGRRVSTQSAREVGIEEIVRLMVGRTLEEGFSRTAKEPGGVALRVVGLCAGPLVRDVSFEARRGEILGFAGLMGSGRTETMRAIFGADPKEAGDVYLQGSDSPARIRSPRDAVRQGIALLTEDRKGQGLLLPAAIRVNVTLTRLRGLARWGWIRPDAETSVAGRFVQALSVRCSSPEQKAVELSGGNQQKVVIAKWLHRDCDILIFDEPTRGIDVGTKFEIYHLLAELAGKGKAILVVSSDLKELLALCDRIAVMSAGRLAATFRRGEWSQDKIMNAALSGYLVARSAE